MAKKREEYNRPSNSLDWNEHRQAEILFPPPGRRLSAFNLHRIVRMALLCRTRTERRVVALRLYHRFELADVAQQMAMPLPRVRELLESIARRLDMAERARAVEDSIRNRNLHEKG